MSFDLPDLRYQKEGIDPEVMLRNLGKDLDLQISVGIWYFTPGPIRFHESYVDVASVERRIEMAHEMKGLGVTGIEAHYPGEINEENRSLYDGLQVVAIPFSHFYEKEFEFGSLSNPDPAVRNKAREIAVGALKMVKETGARCAISWPGMDGYRYVHGKPFLQMWDLFETTLAEAMDEVPGVRVAIEPKAYEPVANNIYRNTAEALLAARRIEDKLESPENRKILDDGKVLVGLNPEIGHVKMSYEVPAAAFSLVGMEGRLAHTHWNSQPDGNFDQDNNIGVVNPDESVALLYALWAMGYREYFGIDIHPENMPVKKAVAINCRALRKMKERISRLPHEEIIDCHLRPEKNRGRLEEILIDHW